MRLELQYKSENASESGVGSRKSRISINLGIPLYCVDISPAQALLIQIDHYNQLIENEKSSERIKQLTEKQEKIKLLFLSGIESKEDRLFYDSLIYEGEEINLYKNYDIKESPLVINNDPVRRYFETHLAYETLCSNLNELTIEELRYHRDLLYYSLSSRRRSKYSYEALLESNVGNDYSDALRKIAFSSECYPDIQDKNRIKLSFIYMCLLYAVKWTEAKDLPLQAVYDQHPLFKKEIRGRLRLDDLRNEYVLSHHLGLQKSFIATPNTRVDRIDHADKNGLFSATRVVDSFACVFESKSAKANFKKLVHPFACSISGTILSQLSCIKELNKYGKFIFARHPDPRRYIVYLKCAMSALLYDSGGHTLHETVSVFKIYEVQKIFRNLVDFNEINLRYLYYSNVSGSPFDKALRDTIKHNKIMLSRALLNHEVQRRVPMKTEFRSSAKLSLFSSDQKDVAQKKLEEKSSDQLEMESLKMILKSTNI